MLLADSNPKLFEEPELNEMRWFEVEIRERVSNVGIVFGNNVGRFGYGLFTAKMKHKWKSILRTCGNPRSVYKDARVQMLANLPKWVSNHQALYNMEI